MTGAVGYVSRLMYLPRGFLLPVVMVFCVLGSYSLNNTMFDVWVMLIFGVFGIILDRAKVPLGPFVIGFVLAPLFEAKLRTGLMMTAGSIMPIITRPLALSFLLIALALLAWSIYGDRKRGRDARSGTGVDDTIE